MRLISPPLTVLLLAAFALVVAAFLGGTWVSLRASAEVQRDAVSITTNAAPSIEDLAATRTDLWRLHDVFSDAVDECTAGRPISFEKINEVQKSLGDDIAAYLRLPVYSGERALQSTALNELAGLRAVAIQSEERLREGHCHEARALVTDGLNKSIEGSSVAMSATLQFNGEKAQELAMQITRSFQQGQQLAVRLNAIAAALTVVVALLLGWAMHRSTRLQADYLRLQRERADELELFASRVAHDIRNPLAAAGVQLDLGRRPTGDPRQALEKTQTILRRITTIVNGLYEFARSGARPIPGESADVGEVVTEVVEEIRAALETDTVQLQVEPFAPCRVAAPPGVLASLLGNLLQNAIKYAGGEVYVRVRANALLRVEVQDNGPGLPPELEKTIFEPYVRGTSIGQHGLGLGLATVKRLSEAYGGRCGVRSASGRGSTFWFELPMVQG